MSTAETRFAHAGESWSERARFDELNSVLYPEGSDRVNLMMHASTLVAARVVSRFMSRNSRREPVLLDFGCGNGRMLRYFADNGWSVKGIDVSEEMLKRARDFGLPIGSEVYPTDGTSIPLADGSIDLVWVSGVLKYGLFDIDSRCRGGNKPDTVSTVTVGEISPYRRIAGEMFRVLKPACHVVNCEMWIDAPPEVFLPDFEQVGFVTKQVRVLRRYIGVPERICEWRDYHRLPERFVLAAGQLCATLRYWIDNPHRTAGGLRDYLFVWQKPGS